MEVLKRKMTHQFNSLVLFSWLFFSIKVNGSEQSHATFKVESVEPIKQSGNQIASSLPAMNEISSVHLVLLGMFLLLLGFIFMKFKKGTLYEK